MFELSELETKESVFKDVKKRESKSHRMNKDTYEIFKEFAALLVDNEITDYCKSGSQVCKSTEPHDFDWFVYENDSSGPVITFLQENDFKIDGSNHLEWHDSRGEFASFKKHNLNIIRVTNKKLYDTTEAATNLVAKHDVKHKECRVEVFECLRTNNWTQAFQDILNGKEEKALDNLQNRYAAPF